MPPGTVICISLTIHRVVRMKYGSPTLQIRRYDQLGWKPPFSETWIRKSLGGTYIGIQSSFRRPKIRNSSSRGDTCASLVDCFEQMCKWRKSVDQLPARECRNSFDKQSVGIYHHHHILDVTVLDQATNICDRHLVTWTWVDIGRFDGGFWWSKQRRWAGGCHLELLGILDLVRHTSGLTVNFGFEIHAGHATACPAAWSGSLCHQAATARYTSDATRVRSTHPISFLNHLHIPRPCTARKFALAWVLLYEVALDSGIRCNSPGSAEENRVILTWYELSVSPPHNYLISCFLPWDWIPCNYRLVKIACAWTFRSSNIWYFLWKIALFYSCLSFHHENTLCFFEWIYVECDVWPWWCDKEL